MRLAQLCGRHSKPSARLLDGDAVLQAGLGEQPALAAAVQPRRPRGRWHALVDARRFNVLHIAHRHPNLGRKDRHHARELVAEHADDGVLLASDAEGLSEGARVATELAPPVALGQDDHARRARGVVFRQDRAAKSGAHAEQAEVVSGDDFAEHQARPISAAHCGEHRRIPGNALEHRDPLAVVLDVGQRVGGIRVAVRAARVNVDQA